MRAFISYASGDRAVASLVASSLQARGFKTFFDKNDLPAGESFDKRIERAIAQCDLFIFLASPEAIQVGRYTLNEIEMARRKWPNPDKRVLPVIIKDMAIETIPEYLRKVTILEPKGNFAAEIGAAAEDMLGWRAIIRKRFVLLALGFVLVIAILGGTAAQNPINVQALFEKLIGTTQP